MEELQDTQLRQTEKNLVYEFLNSVPTIEHQIILKKHYPDFAEL
jgi:hypothetical protein